VKVSVIDLGFNSLKLVSYDVRKDNSFTLYGQKSVHTRLGEGLNETGFLRHEPIRRTIDALKAFREIINLDSIEHVLPVATSAVREAANKDQFLKEVYQQTGFRFRVLSAIEEASYSYFGASRCMLRPNVLFFDIGGGSLEIVHTTNFRIRKILSLPIGALRLTQLYANERGSFPKKSYAKLRKRVLDLLPDREELFITDKTSLIGVGGSVRAIASYDQELRDYPLNKIHGYTLSKEAVDFIRSKLAKSDLDEITKIDCIDKDRAITITAGATVIDLLMNKLELSKLIVSTQGLRDGILAAYVADPKIYHKGDSVGITGLIRQSRSDPLQFSNSTITWFVSQGLIDEEEAEILSHATKIKSNELPLFGPTSLFYILLDEETNLTHNDQLVMALAITRTIRPKTADWLYEKYKPILKPGSKNLSKRVSSLVGLTSLIEKTRTLAKIRWLNEGIVVQILPERNSQNTFPRELLRVTMQEISNTFEIPIKYYVQGSPKTEFVEVRET
jgi:exopolyphosphatase/guanosine-5'-triphosphate,3'-diphosphate pyrophosphatase